jgi:hypothetical protein
MVSIPPKGDFGLHDEKAKSSKQEHIRIVTVYIRDVLKGYKVLSASRAAADDNVGQDFVPV